MDANIRQMKPDLSESEIRKLICILKKVEHSKGEESITYAHKIREIVQENSKTDSSLEFRASANLFADLLEQAWTVRDAKLFLLEPPGISPSPGESAEEVKRRLKAGLLVGRDRQLAEPSVQKFIQKLSSNSSHSSNLGSILDLIDDGFAMARALDDLSTKSAEEREKGLAKLIKPEIEVADPKKKM